MSREEEAARLQAEILSALGLEGATVVTYEEYDELPNSRRHYLSPPPGSGARGVHLRLPDPPMVAALREVLSILGRLGDGSGDVEDALNEARIVALDALAEFDRSTS